MCENFGNSGGEGGTFWGLILENLKGRGGHTANAFCWGGMDIFWSYLVSSMIAPCCVLTGGASRSKNSM